MFLISLLISSGSVYRKELTIDSMLVAYKVVSFKVNKFKLDCD